MGFMASRLAGCARSRFEAGWGGAMPETAQSSTVERGTAARGLLGGIVAWLLRRGPAPARVGAVMWLLFAVADTVFRDIHGVPILAGALVGFLVMPRPAR